MSHMPRLHPDDLQQLVNEVRKTVTQELTMLHQKDVAMSREQTYTVKEAAKMLNRDPGTILRHIKKNLLQATKQGKSWIITQQSINQYKNEK